MKFMVKEVVAHLGECGRRKNMYKNFIIEASDVFHAYQKVKNQYRRRIILTLSVNSNTGQDN